MVRLDHGAAEQRRYRDDRARGVQHAAIGAGLAAATGYAGRLLVGPAAMNVVATTVTVGGRMLASEAVAIGAALDAGDLDEARARLPALVGRDPSALGADEVARAVVESVAENTVDAVVAPALWGTVAGGVGALAYRAVNTMDAMVGHHSDRYERFGWAAARLDDLANWVPARVAAALVALLRPGRAGEVWRAVRDDAPRHPSPNAGRGRGRVRRRARICASAASTATATASRSGPRSAAAGPRRPRDIAAAVRLSRQLAGALIAAVAIAAAAPSVVRRLKEG